MADLQTLSMEKREMKMDETKDYSGIWIDLMAEVKVLHHYCLAGDWSMANKTAKNCSKFADDLSLVLQEMSEVK
jgi:hypothetical protein